MYIFFFACSIFSPHPSSIFHPRLNKSKKEEVVFIVFQFWLFIISMIAVMNDSVPHTYVPTYCAGLTLNLYLGLPSFSLEHWIRDGLAMLSGVPGITNLSSVNLWWTRPLLVPSISFRNTSAHGQHMRCVSDWLYAMRTSFLKCKFQIPDLILNVTALLTSGYLSWTLLRVGFSINIEHAWSVTRHTFRSTMLSLSSALVHQSKSCILLRLVLMKGWIIRTSHQFNSISMQCWCAFNLRHLSWWLRWGCGSTCY